MKIIWSQSQYGHFFKFGFDNFTHMHLFYFAVLSLLMFKVTAAAENWVKTGLYFMLYESNPYFFYS